MSYIHVSQVPTWLQQELEFAVSETNKRQLGRLSRTSIDSDILPTFDPLNSPEDKDSNIRPPKLFAPTPTPRLESVGEIREEKTTDKEQSEAEKKRPESRNQSIRQEPVRIPIPRLQTSTSTTSLQRLKDVPSTTAQLQAGRPGPLGLKKAYSNIDVGPSHQASTSKKPLRSTVKVASRGLQKNVPQPFSSPVRRTATSSSGKNANPSPLSSPRRSSDSDHTSPERKGPIATSPASPASEGSEVGSDHDLRSPVLSSSSEGEVYLCKLNHNL